MGCEGRRALSHRQMNRRLFLRYGALLRSAQKYELRDRFIEPIPLESVRHHTARRYQRQLPATCARGAHHLRSSGPSSDPFVALIFFFPCPRTRMAIFSVPPRSSFGNLLPVDRERAFLSLFRTEPFEFSRNCRAARSFASFRDTVIPLEFFQATLETAFNSFSLFSLQNCLIEIGLLARGYDDAYISLLISNEITRVLENNENN